MNIYMYFHIFVYALLIHLFLIKVSALGRQTVRVTFTDLTCYVYNYTWIVILHWFRVVTCDIVLL